MHSCSRASAPITLLPQRHRGLLTAIFLMELKWPSSQYGIHFLIKFSLRCPNSWMGILCDLALPHLSCCMFHYTPYLYPLPPLFSSTKEFLASASCVLCYFISFNTRIPLLEIPYLPYVTCTHPSRPGSNDISSVESPVIPSSRASNPLLFPTLFLLHT